MKLVGAGWRMSDSEKMAWLRKDNPKLPDIYHMPGFRPNGCGPDLMPWLRWLPEWIAVTVAWIAAAIIPDWLPGLPHWDLCGDGHDYDYFVGGTEKERKRADKRLRRRMRRLTPLRANLWSIIAWVRMRALSQVFYWAVRIGGRNYFNYREKS